MITYTQFKAAKINTGSIGWEKAGKNDAYFCTPKGAKIIGRAGVDGIHYCTVRALGDTVFAVNPTNPAGHYVHPIARNFEDLLRLLLACLNMNVIEQVWMWDEEQLTEQIAAVRASEYFDPAPLDAIREKFGLTPMEDPYTYLYRLQKTYNYTQIPFTDEYYAMAAETGEWQPPAWKVTMEGSFTPERGKGGAEIPLNKPFRWGNEIWHVPAVYLCSGGIVADFFAEIDAPITAPNSRAIHFTPTMIVNGTALSCRRSCGEAWLPHEQQNEEDGSPVAQWLLTHYGFDLSRTWIIRRCVFPCESKIDRITALHLHMEREREHFPGIRFSNPRVGDTILLRHPTTGIEHTLTVQHYAPHEIEQSINDDTWIYPTHCILMQYTVTPELPASDIGVRDLRDSDPPRRKQAAPGDDFCSVISVARTSDGTPRAVCSGLRFEQPQQVDWCVEFRIKTVEDTEIQLI
ncbi:MAG: hypothetical protein IKL84_00605 [Clostridia bacterium]|nr:hypothetical protein [Clostridia bacterium]